MTPEIAALDEKQLSALHGKQHPPRDTAWATSQENVEIVRRAFAFEIDGVGDRAEAEAIFDPDVSSIGRAHGENLR